MFAAVSFLIALQTPDEAKTAIVAGYANWSKSFLAKDMKGIESLVHAKFVTITKVKDEITKKPRAGFVGSIKRQFDDPKFVMKKFDIKVEKVEKTKEGWMATIEERFGYTYDGKEVKAGQRTADLWIKSEKGWQVASTELLERLKD